MGGRRSMKLGECFSSSRRPPPITRLPRPPVDIRARQKDRAVLPVNSTSGTGGPSRYRTKKEPRPSGGRAAARTRRPAPDGGRGGKEKIKPQHPGFPCGPPPWY